MHRSSKKKQQPGVVLLMALLLLAAVTASTIGTAITISNTLTQSANLDNFILASFAGDSGIERGLAIVKQKRKTATISTAITELNSALNTASQVSSTSTRGQFQGSARAISDPITIPTFRPGESTSFDILEYCQDGVGCTIGNLKTVSVTNLQIKGSAPTSFGATSCGNVPAGWKGSLEVSWILLDQNGDSSCTGRYFVPTSVLACGSSPSLLNNVTSQLGTPCTELTPKGYRVKVRALDLTTTTNPTEETIANLSIDALNNFNSTNNTGTSIGLPGRIQIDVTGDTGSSRANKTASVLWQIPASGLFNYVLFTEGDIIPN